MSQPAFFDSFYPRPLFPRQLNEGSPVFLQYTAADGDTTGTTATIVPANITIRVNRRSCVQLAPNLWEVTRLVFVTFTASSVSVAGVINIDFTAAQFAKYLPPPTENISYRMVSTTDISDAGGNLTCDIVAADPFVTAVSIEGLVPVVGAGDALPFSWRFSYLTNKDPLE